MKKVPMIALSLTMVLALSACSNAKNDILKAVEEGDYSKAQQIYDEKLADKPEKANELIDEFITRLNKAYDDYNAGNISYEAAEKIMTEIDNSDIVQI